MKIIATILFLLSGNCFAETFHFDKVVNLEKLQAELIAQAGFYSYFDGVNPANGHISYVPGSLDITVYSSNEELPSNSIKVAPTIVSIEAIKAVVEAHIYSKPTTPDE